ncbi:MAG: hypothetical protein QOI10_207 [Solirubrobacterales bacterium]|jgi:tetrahydromethanopterin S-methyltransferase subunit G|nr:hypothetical protein [Solirubrobacterales bacterium]
MSESHSGTGYDEALAETLADEDETAELRKRLLSGGASGDDRQAARERLDDLERRRFDLAHPVPPHDSAQQLDAGELEIERSDLDDAKAWKQRAEEIRERLAEAIDGALPVETVVRLGVRIPADQE